MPVISRPERLRTSTPFGSQSPRAKNRPPGPAGSKGRIGFCAVLCTAGPGLARALSLNRRARHRAIRAEHTAIALPRTQRGAAADTFAEELAGISRHGFRFGGSAKWAGDNAFKDHGAYLCTSRRYSIFYARPWMSRSPHGGKQRVGCTHNGDF